MYDVIILGATLSGSTAAAILSRAGHSVAVLAKDDPAAADPDIAWVARNAASTLEPLALKLDDAMGPPVGEFVLISGDMTKKVGSKLKSGQVYLVDLSKLTGHLLGLATQAGTVLTTNDPATGLKLAEDHVDVTTRSGQHVTGRFLIAADGVESLLAKNLGWPAPRHPLTCHQVEVERRVPQQDEPVRIVLAVGHPEPGATAYAYVAPMAVTFGLTSPAGPGRAAQQLARFSRLAGEIGLIPPDLPTESAIAHSRTLPVGGALELETHVAKRSLLIGSAGRFVAALSNQTAYPALWSAQLAAKMIQKALTSPTPQDQLAKFETLWRTQMAAFLQPPNTDLKFLLPLVFTNPKMADRFVTALLTGQDI